ncbi:hypothetical protein H6G74_17845 [Nostoc spongiaeforme FACHB-130]|uniref:Uncharacterized protein n=1 Tax=Nostoc spongiaeforme FACHB-130 TaxID=1357510 RepID=A0ABR8FZR0_9NOSO|nr:CTB family bacteriocin [Nostoc spongiaeforme]MBD2596174.1 hypothetical protein [Nostoc spongiaeforme FACHB-130]
MSQELFTDLAIEQQETISGGSLFNVQEINSALFKQNTQVLQLATTATAGANGASSTKVFSAGTNNILSKSGDILRFFL